MKTPKALIFFLKVFPFNFHSVKIYDKKKI